jgi:hypothetical protein
MMSKPASPEQIREILGEMPETTLAAIVATGATIEEVSEARAWLTADDATAKELQHRGQGRVADIVELLAPDEVDDEGLG